MFLRTASFTFGHWSSPLYFNYNALKELMMISALLALHNMAALDMNSVIICFVLVCVLGEIRKQNDCNFHRASLLWPVHITGKSKVEQCKDFFIQEVTTKTHTVVDFFLLQCENTVTKQRWHQLFDDKTRENRHSLCLFTVCGMKWDTIETHICMCDNLIHKSVMWTCSEQMTDVKERGGAVCFSIIKPLVYTVDDWLIDGLCALQNIIGLAFLFSHCKRFLPAT